VSLTFTPARLKQTEFNMRFTTGTGYQGGFESVLRTINHALAEFTENKRWQRKARAFDDVVNRNLDSVYQTLWVSILAVQYRTRSFQADCGPVCELRKK